MELVLPHGDRVYRADILGCWEDLAERTGIFDPEKADWMVPDLIGVHGAYLGAGAFATRVKNAGELLTPEQKRALGINPRIKIGDRLALTLTPKGLEDVNASVTAIFMAPALAIWRRAALTQAGEAGWPVTLPLSAAGNVCLSALELHGRFFSVDDAPRLPLPGCDKVACGCVFRGDYRAAQPEQAANDDAALTEPASAPAAIAAAADAPPTPRPFRWWEIAGMLAAAAMVGIVAVSLIFAVAAS